MQSFRLDPAYRKILEATLQMYEAGQEAGTHELVKTPLAEARAYAEELFTKYGRNLDTEIPNFDKNYLFAQKQAGTGKTMRKDMPVIDEQDVKKFQARLQKGHIDLREPFSSVLPQADPFPEGLKGKDAKLFLQKGLHLHDGDKTDDVVKVNNAKTTVGSLHPIQKQIYFDKSIQPIAEFGAVASTSFMENKTFFITSDDDYIIDGHHRFLGGVLLNPKMKVNTVKIDLPIKTLLPLTLSYGDAVGNKRNL